MARPDDIDLLAGALAEDETQEPEYLPPSLTVEIGSGHGQWEPDMNPTQRIGFYDPTEIILLYGPKGTGKSIGALHRIVRHCYEEWNALVVIITPSIRT